MRKHFYIESLIVLVVLAGCSLFDLGSIRVPKKTAKPAPTEQTVTQDAPAEAPAPPGETAPERELRLAKNKVDKLQTDLDAAKLAVVRKQQEKDDSDWAWAHKLAHWIVGLCIIATIVDGGAAVYFKSSTLASLVIVGLVMTALGFASDWIVYHRVLATIVVGIVAAAGTAVLWFESHKTKKENGVLSTVNDKLNEGLEAAVKVAEFLKPKAEPVGAAALRIAAQQKIVGPATTIIDEVRSKLGLI